MPTHADIESPKRLLREFLDTVETRGAALSICQAAGTTDVDDVVSKLDEIRRLNLFGREFHSIRAIQLLPNLEWLAAKDAAVHDVRGIEACGRLIEVNLAGNPIEDISSIGNLGTLQKLDLSGTRISKIDSLIGCCSLKSLRLCNTSIESFDPLERLPLTELGLWNAGVQSFDQFPPLPNLRDFWAPENPITSLDGIDRFPNLINLDLGDCELQSICGIEHLPNLRTIALAGNWTLGSLRPLFESRIESLTIERAQLDDESLEFLESRGV